MTNVKLTGSGRLFRKKKKRKKVQRSMGQTEALQKHSVLCPWTVDASWASVGRRNEPEGAWVINSGFSVLKQPGFSTSNYFIAARLHFPGLSAQATAVALGNRHLQSTFCSRTHCSVPEARPAGGTATDSAGTCPRGPQLPPPRPNPARATPLPAPRLWSERRGENPAKTY